MITNVHNATIWVNDQDRAKKFYTKTLGFELCKDIVQSGVRYIKVAPRNGETVIFLMLPEGDWKQNYASTVGSVQALTLSVSDMSAVYEDLSAKGVTFVSQPHLASNGNTYAVFEDSEGNHINLLQMPIVAE